MTELSSYEPDPGTEQLAMMATFEVKLILGFRQEAGRNVKLEVRRLAAAFAAFVRLQRWGCPIGPAQVLGAHPDNFSYSLDQYEVWRVEWEQVIHLGKSVWDDGPPPPQHVMLGIAPLIGIGHEPDYVEIEELPHQGAV